MAAISSCTWVTALKPSSCWPCSKLDNDILQTASPRVPVPSTVVWKHFFRILLGSGKRYGSSNPIRKLPHWGWEAKVGNASDQRLVQFSSVQSLSCVQPFVTPWIAARQASLSVTNSRSSLKLMSIESVMPSSHLILCRPVFLLPPIPPSISFFQWVNSSHEVAKVLEFQL